ncbi:hypothetical protein [Sphingopyxis yananensis]|uniref:hypothetical protein n=1 Tax=Sphingopyxis yananensis TaxID=2886687 RepID=UPI001D11F7A5|nr:hypothetical protein [Sphingopyxis yananensis]MCC2602483.1 hypothetical protein [Sphingopyxis yananensis]
MSSMIPPNPSLLQKIADELENMRQETESLGALLCSDPDVALRHMNALQSLDLLAQTQLALAKILRAENPEDALANTDLHNLRERLMNAHWE